MGLSQILALNGMLTMGREMPLRKLRGEPMILNAIDEKLKRQSKDDFNGRHFEAWPMCRRLPGIWVIHSAIGILRRCSGNVASRSIIATSTVGFWPRRR
ncbi:hypothetical protein A6U98_21320 [Rhizobium sp. WYCCWR10014]|nr:hypothetical protein A6U98_21320 [Rhizobium sp. WYCCWR10014]